jgi:hypothetical protein
MMPTLEPITTMFELKELPNKAYLLLFVEFEPFVIQKVEFRPGEWALESEDDYIGKWNFSLISFVDGKLVLNGSEVAAYEAYHIVKESLS